MRLLSASAALPHDSMCSAPRLQVPLLLLRRGCLCNFSFHQPHACTEGESKRRALATTVLVLWPLPRIFLSTSKPASAVVSPPVCLCPTLYSPPNTAPCMLPSQTCLPTYPIPSQSAPRPSPVPSHPIPRAPRAQIDRTHASKYPATHHPSGLGRVQVPACGLDVFQHCTLFFFFFFWRAKRDGMYRGSK
ncbi:hypothetical protein HDK90DRAFT_83844 [Phyllosticta capitalensis]|uniref:Uncharacterized protein n=1 Tax=Phyllosticta capitalensis TaxID=121624 RepID=A0ABR1YBI1_9PEZI